MKTLGIVLLVLLAMFFGGCSLAALLSPPYFIGDSRISVVVIAALFCVVCILGIRAINKIGDPPPRDSDPPSEDDRDGS